MVFRTPPRQTTRQIIPDHGSRRVLDWVLVPSPARRQRAKANGLAPGFCRRVWSVFLMPFGPEAVQAFDTAEARLPRDDSKASWEIAGKLTFFKTSLSVTAFQS